MNHSELQMRSDAAAKRSLIEPINNLSSLPSAIHLTEDTGSEMRDDLTSNFSKKAQRRTKQQRVISQELDLLMATGELKEAQLHQVYVWVDEVPITRVKKNLNKDFADGSLMAEIVRYYLPPAHRSLVQLQSYPETTQPFQMRINWSTLNNSVIAKVGACVGAF